MGTCSFNFKELKAFTNNYFCKFGDLIEIDNGPPYFEKKEERISRELITIGNTIFAIACYNFESEKT